MLCAQADRCSLRAVTSVSSFYDLKADLPKNKEIDFKVGSASACISTVERVSWREGNRVADLGSTHRRIFKARSCLSST